MNKDIDEKAFKEELIKQAEDYLIKTQSVEGTIEIRKEEYEKIKDSFNKLWALYNKTSKLRNSEQKQFELVRIRMHLYSILISMLYPFYRSDAYSDVVSFGKDISLSINDLKLEKELLLNIKSAIHELEKYSAVDCNYDIALLLSLIYDKNILMAKVLNEDLKSLSIRLKGIDYASNSGKREELNIVNENIKNKVEELKLNRRY